MMMQVHILGMLESFSGMVQLGRSQARTLMERQQMIIVDTQYLYLLMALEQLLEQYRMMEMVVSLVMLEFINGAEQLGQSQAQILMAKQWVIEVDHQSLYLQMDLYQPLGLTATMDHLVIRAILVMLEYINGMVPLGLNQVVTSMETVAALLENQFPCLQTDIQLQLDPQIMLEYLSQLIIHGPSKAPI